MAMKLEARGLTLDHGGPTVLSAIDLGVEAGSRTLLIGANGSGKTTLLRALCGSLRPTAGDVVVDGEPLQYNRAALRRHRQRVQLVLQDPDEQLFSADVRQDVSFGPTNLNMKPDDVLRRVDETLALLSITHLADRPCHQLSYGERKRVALAGAVAMRPDVLLLDEPTAGLDPAGVEEMLDILERLQALGTTLVMSTHDLNLALRIATQVAVVAGGKPTVGEPVEVLNDVELLASARLTRPWPLELASQLGLDARPRTLDEMVRCLR